ncbi:UDP-phosphate alpha N-acetylglucosaminyltransferase [Stappia sp. ES.058]|uniref:UDP-phosphate alpha N-acetylglucosaminyltransferase n=1 Tax=Stappia sp. ES.058 TaxID=1881061 RepID=UPI000879CB08|nr:UDP-phosphate alpha N-acetylglucosaminyltransferase [Stappia sp. ES.058]SDU48792.1 putative polymerase [Stappia sp. ES.058]
MLRSQPDPAPGSRAASLPRGFSSVATRPDTYDLWLRAVFAIVIAALVFNCLLAFVNTRVMGISASHVMLVEVLLIGTGFMLALERRVDLYVVLTIYLSYMALILAMRAELDLKGIRDGLIPICFYFLGRGVRDIRSVDKLVMACAAIVIGVGLFEYFLLDVFIANININDYYIARGTIQAGDNFNEGSDLFISGIRPEGRNFFPFLGSHRVSSVFLEPVSMGNFGAFLGMWALFRKDMARRKLLFAASATVIILGDARFGLFVCFAFFGAFLAYRFVPRVVWWLVPAMLAFLLVLYGLSTTQVGWDDNLGGRWFHSARLFLKLDLPGLFGVSGVETFLDDSGYAYTLHQFGLIGVIVLWTVFVFVPVRSSDAWRFRALVITYVSLLMVVSNSIYSIKTAALLWLCVGATDVWAGFAAGKRARSKAPEAPPPFRQRPRTSRYSAS